MKHQSTQKLVNSQQIQSKKSFIQKHYENLSKQFLGLEDPLRHVNINILSQKQISKAANEIKNNRLVAFPTETVYGLGANALNQSALLEIYKVKKRPLTDPIIVHVLDFEHARSLVKITSEQQLIVQLLTSKFWPGPLTIILQANLDILPSVVTAQTGFVGIRAPKHPYARQLLKQSMLPIGAPSANLFAHVSPTSPVHVFNDFYGENISLVDGDRCQFGVQSTVIKVENDGSKLQILREGSLSANILKKYLKQVSESTKLKLPEVFINVRVTKCQENQNMQSPGQLLKHYSPYLPCFYCQKLEDLKREATQQQKFKNIAFISFSTIYQSAQKCFKYYFDASQSIQSQQTKQNEQSQLFCSKEQQIKMKNLYFLLRKSQNLDVQYIVLGWEGQKSGTIWDKIFRATEGRSLSKL